MKTNPALKYLYAASFLSGLGTGMTLVLVNWTLIQEYGSTSLIGLLSSLSYLASLLILPKLSMALDSHDKRVVLQRINWVACVAQMLIALLLVSQQGLIPAVVLSAVFSVVARMADQQARLAIAQQITTVPVYKSVSRQLEVLRQSITLASGFIAALLISSLTIAQFVVLDATTFAAAGLLLTRVASPRDKAVGAGVGVAPQPVRKLVDALDEACAYFHDNRRLFAAMVSSLVPYVLVLTQLTVYPAHVRQVLHAQGDVYAQMGMVFGIGALIGPAANRVLNRFLPEKGAVLGVGFIGFLIPSVAIMFTTDIALTFGCLVFFSISHSVIRIERLAWLMEYTPTARIGHVSGIYEVIGIIGVVISSLFAGLVVDLFGVRQAWFAMLAVALCAFVSYRLSMPVLTGQKG